MTDFFIIGDGNENWVLVCGTCHDRIDVQPNTFTVDDLRDVKATHEKWVRSQLTQNLLALTFAELDITTKAICCSLTEIPSDFVVVSPAHKMRRNGLTDASSLLITMGSSKCRDVQGFIQHISKIDQDFPDRLKTGFVTEYERQRNLGMVGDALFELLHECAALRTFRVFTIMKLFP